MNLGQATHLSGQAVQMNPGSGGRLSQHQRLQVASGHHGVDPEFETMRRTMCQNIKEFMEEKKMVSENRVLDLAWRFEEVMYRKHPNKADYYNILKEPIDRHLNDAVMTITAQGQQRQQMSRHVTSSSSYGTMIPTPGMSQSASGNSRMPYVMDNTGGNSMTGSMSNGSQQRSSNVPLNSTTSNISSVTGSVSIQRQVTHMIPTPGFSNQQTLPANSECSNGAGYLNGESNAMPQMQQQQKSFSSNQSCCPVQHLGGHAGSGVHSSMLENSSSYGSSDAQLNGGMELCRSNIQIINKTAASESFSNLSPYGSSHNKHLQQQFSHPPLQRTPTSADMAASRSLYGTGSSALTASSNLDNNPANLLSNSRMNSGLLTSQTTMQYIRPQPHIKAEVLDPQVKVNFRKSQITHEQLLQQQHQLQPNHPPSQFMQNQYSINLQQQNSQHHQVMCRGNSLEQCQLGSGHAEQLLDQGDLLHNELISSQATKHADLPNLQGHYQITSSHDNNKRSQISGQFSGSQNFQIPVSHDSQQLLPPHQQSDDGSNGVSCFLKGTYTEPLFQPHCRSQPTEKAYVTNSLSTEKQVQDDFFQRTMAQDRAQQPVLTDQHIVGCAVTSLDLKSSKLPTRGSEQATRNIKNYRNQLRWLLMLIHAKACPAPIGSCKSQYCACVQDLVKHFKFCQRKNCSYMYCRESKKVFYHYKNCVDEHCPVCSLAKERLRRSSEQVDKHNPAEPIITSQQNTDQRITNGVHDDRMDIDLVAVETFDDQPSASKRLRLQPVFPNASENGNSHVPVPQANPGFVLQEDHPRQLEQNNEMVPKQGVNVRVNTQPPQKHVIIGYGTDGKRGAMANNVIPGVLNEIDSHFKQESFLADKEMNENVLDVKNKTNGSTDVTMSKLGKPKIKGVSLMELFSPEQINEHINSLRQWVGQSKAKAQKNQAIGYSENENSCQLCKVEKLNFEPPPIYCSPCGARIKRNASYYTGSTTEARHHFCTLCYNESRSHTIEVEGIRFLKANLEKRRNDDEAEEGWVQCDKCECWQHQICALFNVRRNDGGEAEYTCHNCYVQEIKHGLRMPLPESALLGAKDLPRTVLSDHIEERLFKRLRDERQDRANLSQKSFDEVPGADGLVVRVVSSVDKKLEVKPHFFEIFREDNYPAEFPYKSKAILLFQKIEGVEVCLFGMYVQEFGAECAFPNQRRVYLSYLDSVKYFKPEIKTVSGEALRTYVYHEILIGYLDYCKRRGFTSCYIWACPPLKGEDYILYCHPEIQKTPKSDKLREWYLSMLQKAIKERIVVELTNLYDHFFTTKECKAEVSAARLPYFDGDYWPGAAEDMINQLRLEEDGGKLQKGKMKKTITNRASKAAGHTDLSGNASKDDVLMQKLGKTICPMKEDFIMVHLQYSCSHCSILMVSGRRWVCDQCKRFYICDKCYDAEQRLEENERHPSNSRDSHTLHPVEIVGVPEDTKDRDDILESEFFDTRQAFLSLCQGNHYQYDTLRRAKHSSMMVLYHLHNPTAPAFVTTCNVCNHDIETGQGWRCEECPDFDVCTVCYQKDGGASHRHKLTNGPSSADPNAQNKEARQKRVQQVRVMLELLVHVPLCHVPDCQYPNCRRVKGLFRHGHHCKIRASGGCEPCKKMWYLIRLHARVCKESNCSMPRCRDLKDHLRRLQQQSDSRRRAAVNEMMRQRTAEVAGN